MDALRALRLQELRRRAQRAARRRHVVDHHHIAALHVAHHGERVHVAVAHALLGDDGEIRAELAAVAVGRLRAARIGRDHDGLLEAAGPDVLEDHRLRMEMVERNVEEALDLVRVEIHRQHAVRARRLEEVRHETRRDRHARLVLPVLARIAVVRDHGRDARRASALQRIHDHEQLHVRLVGRGRSRLNDKHVTAAHALLHLAERLAVRKMLDVDLVERAFEILRHLLRERQVRRSRKKHQLVVISLHLRNPNAEIS